VRAELVNATATLVKMADNVASSATTHDHTASVRLSGREISVKQG